MGEMIKYGIKLAITVATFAAVMVAVTVLVNLVTLISIGSVVGEVLALIGVFMPWNASAMGVFSLGISSAVAFLVAWKIYKMLSNFNNQT